jgi:hypothetical protein
MTAIVSRERAKGTCVFAAAGLLMLVAAVVMMFAAAPGLARLGAAGPRVTSTQLTADLSHQAAFRSDSASTRACLAGPRALRACAEAYTPSSSSDR